MFLLGGLAFANLLKSLGGTLRCEVRSLGMNYTRVIPLSQPQVRDFRKKYGKYRYFLE